MPSVDRMTAAESERCRHELMRELTRVRHARDAANCRVRKLRGQLKALSGMRQTALAAIKERDDAEMAVMQTRNDLASLRQDRDAWERSCGLAAEDRKQAESHADLLREQLETEIDTQHRYEQTARKAKAEADLLREQLAESRRQCDVYRGAWEREQAVKQARWWRVLASLVGRAAL